jgi:predicted GNAT family acetyltransferase
VEPRVVDNPEELRYELWLGADLEGEIRYTREEDGTIVLVHTDVDPSHKGEGLGNALVQGALDDLREGGIGYQSSARSSRGTSPGTRSRASRGRAACT